MARRGGTARFRCPTDDCTEAAFYEYSSNADYARLYRGRHRNPEQLLTPSNPTRTVVLTADSSKRFPELDKLFWREDDAADVGSGYTFGPGFSAHADDFPKGSRLVITITADVAERKDN